MNRWYFLPLVVACAFVPMLAQTAQPTSAETPKSSRVSGEVRDENGGVIPGALIEIVISNQLLTPIKSDETGAFTFITTESGDYVVTVAATGFQSKRVEGTSKAGEPIELGTIALRLSPLVQQVYAVTEEQLALQQMHQEEQQRVLGILPNFYTAFDPQTVHLTQPQKFKLATRAMLDPTVFLVAAARAGQLQYSGTPSDWAQDANGFGMRYGISLGGAAAEVVMTDALFPVVLHQDPRYFYKGNGTKKQRLVYALKCAVMQKGDSGQWQPAYSKFLGHASAAVITTSMYPADNRDWGTQVGTGFAVDLAASAGVNVLREFVLTRFTTHVPKQQ